MTFACGLYDRMVALKTGEVQPEGIDLNFINIDNPRELFDRMVGRLEFDASEMSSSEYVSRFAAGICAAAGQRGNRQVLRKGSRSHLL